MGAEGLSGDTIPLKAWRADMSEAFRLHTDDVGKEKGCVTNFGSENRTIVGVVEASAALNDRPEGSKTR